MTNRIQFYNNNNNIPTISISGETIRDSNDGKLLLMEHQNILNIEKIGDLQNKIFLGFQNIIGITQQNIFHNINIINNKIIFKKHDETNAFNLTNSRNYLLDKNISGTLAFNTIYNYFPNLGNNVTIDLNNYFQKELYQDIFNKNTVNFDEKNLIYVITNITTCDPLFVSDTNNNIMHSNIIYKLPNSNIVLSNLYQLTNSLKLYIYYDIYYDNDSYSCSTGKWEREYILLEKDVQLDYNIDLSNQIPTNIPTIPQVIKSCCPEKEIHHTMHDKYKIGQLASKKMQRNQLIKYSKSKYTVKLQELNYRNVCVKQFIDTTINVSIDNLNNSNKCRHAPKNRF